MDIFQFVADFLHLVAVVMLLLKILANKNVIGTIPPTQVYHTAHNNYSLSSSSPATSISSSAGRPSMPL